MSGKQPRACLSDPGCGTGDDRDPARQHRHPPSLTRRGMRQKLSDAKTKLIDRSGEVR